MEEIGILECLSIKKIPKKNKEQMTRKLIKKTKKLKLIGAEF